MSGDAAQDESFATPAGEAPEAHAQDGAAPRAAKLLTREREARPELFAAARDKLSSLEAFNVRWARATFSSPRFNALCAWAERAPGAAWVDVCTRNLRRIHGIDRLPPLDQLGNFVLVANHRSYFDLYVVSMILFRHGLTSRILYPVRSNFFYDSALGWWVNGIMSFWSMYPPIFREKKRAVLNHTALSEVIWALKNTRVAAGIHPEGTRNKGDDPYSLLPAQSGVGRVIHEARVAVIPVFVNGLTNRFVHQVISNFTRKGERVNVVFGSPVDLGDLLSQPASAKTYRSIAERVMSAIAGLGEEERRLRGTEPATTLLPPK
ncbi:MAG: 1-acyl-sn-glycerol-3-phosphate acyltransferase [Deltaproteobacteria bacterium]|nr:1-acyl-sn-glycerol-3-phosphate acyltransferase [Deltaproteobacteria bacterium]